MNFPHINSFDTDNPNKLARQLSELEDNTGRALAALESEAEQQASAIVFSPRGMGTIVAIQPGQQLSVNTGIASAAVVFPALSPDNFGRRFVLIKQLGANSVVTSCKDATVLCNGAAFPTIAAAGVSIFYCDATGYYR